MTIEQELALFALPDERYFALDEDALLDLQEAFSDLVEGAGPDAAGDTAPRVRLGAPTRVDVAASERVPVLVGTFQTGLRAWQVNLDPNLHLLVKHHASGALVHAAPLHDMRRGAEPRPSGVGDPPDELNATSTSAGAVVVDLRDKLADHLYAGAISVTAVVYDIASNTVPMQLAGAPDAPERPPAVSPGVDAASAAQPVQIAVPAQVSRAQGLRIGVASRLPAAAVRSDAADRPIASTHVVLVALDRPPAVIAAHAPARPAADGAFDVAFWLDRDAPEPGDYRVYVELGDRLAGPFALRVTE